jgi:hypothetical protein
MVEIKCPVSREIKMSGDIFDICPEYYWVQVQLQLECCNLEECDFWQCSLYEYVCFEEFLDDTDKDEPYRSKKTGFEKGCLIQLLPIEKTKEMENMKQNDIIYDNAIYIYPPKVDMSPYDCNIWITETISNLYMHSEYKGYYVDRVLYWRLNKSNCTLIRRDTEWFKKSLPELKQMWDYVEFFRANADKLNILVEYIESMPRKMNDKIMKTISAIYDIPKNKSESENEKYLEMINKIIAETTQNKIKKQKDLENKLLEDKDDHIEFNNTTYAF